MTFGCLSLFWRVKILKIDIRQIQYLYIHIYIEIYLCNLFRYIYIYDMICVQLLHTLVSFYLFHTWSNFPAFTAAGIEEL